MVAVWRIVKFRRAEAPVTGPVTKFGGQPHWLGPAQWPVSAAWGTPMRFVCQIVLEPELVGAGPVRLAYVFVTHGDHGRDVEEFDPDVVLPDGGENAVVVQPGAFAGPTRPLTSGPTLYHADGSAAEYTVDLVRGEDPEPISFEAYLALPPGRRDDYFRAVDQDKIGGTDLPLDPADLPEGGPWRLLLRLTTNWTPFYLNLGAAPVASAFLSTDGREGCLLVHDS
ncbi:YwqG family protein [Plantactinospora endophytica]|uniref:DUF1963 domain-containing protein n=1 Tax=Plantactinospora endophytica TaxID=673535 RepID=A0ABQ4E0E5_9ACTN|nr:hypothetical protein [Plantactinospora endophytica]GIG88168.1 hypothetical protein Pen02_31040 [Plantactinospora endophytica]